MMDLQHRLDEIAGPAVPPTTAQLDADLARGRRALRRRRTVQTIAGSTLAVAALTAAFTFTNGIGTVPADGRDTTFPAAAGGAPALKVVAYTGKQPKAFSIDKVPEGYFIQTEDDYTLLLAPDFVKKRGPNVDPSKDPVYDPNMFVGKIMIGLESRDGSGPADGKDVQVGDKEGVLVKSPLGETPDGPLPMPSDGDTGWQLYVKQPSGKYMIVQFWQGLGLSEAQMIEVAAGVTVHKGAKAAAG